MDYIQYIKNLERYNQVPDETFWYNVLVNDPQVLPDLIQLDYEMPFINYWDLFRWAEFDQQFYYLLESLDHHPDTDLFNFSQIPEIEQILDLDDFRLYRVIELILRHPEWQIDLTFIFDFLIHQLRRTQEGFVNPEFFPLFSLAINRLEFLNYLEARYPGQVNVVIWRPDFFFRFRCREYLPAMIRRLQSEHRNYNYVGLLNQIQIRNLCSGDIPSASELALKKIIQSLPSKPQIYESEIMGLLLKN